MNNTGKTKRLGFATNMEILGIRSMPGVLALALEVEDADKKEKKQRFECLLRPEQAIEIGAQLAEAGEQERIRKNLEGDP